MRRDLFSLRPAAIGFLTVLTMTAPVGAFQLVTKQEAGLPPAESSDLTFRGSPTRRPAIVTITPAQNAGLVTSPMKLIIRFQSFGGAKINPGSVVVTYLKKPSINVTQRLSPFIRAEGIDATEAELPPGAHEFRIEVHDTDGRVGGAIVSIQVAQ